MHEILIRTAQVEEFIGRGLRELAAVLVLEVLLVGSVLLLDGVDPSSGASDCRRALTS